MKTLTIVAILLPALAAAGAGHEEAIPDIRDRVRLDQFVIQAHRGGGTDLPENTLESFQAAWKWGVVPEADIRTSKDGVICAFHDATFARVVKDASPELKRQGVADLTWRELQQLDVGAYAGKPYAGQRIARLEDALALMSGHPRRCLYLDVKKVSLKQMAKLVKKHHVEKQVIFTSTHHEPIRKWKKMAPASQSLLWMGESQEILGKRLEELAKADFEGITSLQIHVHLREPGSPEPFSPSPDFLPPGGRHAARPRHHLPVASVEDDRPEGLPTLDGTGRRVVRQRPSACDQAGR